MSPKVFFYRTRDFFVIERKKRDAADQSVWRRHGLAIGLGLSRGENEERVSASQLPSTLCLPGTWEKQAHFPLRLVVYPSVPTVRVVGWLAGWVLLECCCSLSLFVLGPFRCLGRFPVSRHPIRKEIDRQRSFISSEDSDHASFIWARRRRRPILDRTTQSSSSQATKTKLIVQEWCNPPPGKKASYARVLIFFG